MKYTIWLCLRRKNGIISKDLLSKKIVHQKSTNESVIEDNKKQTEDSLQPANLYSERIKQKIIDIMVESNGSISKSAAMYGCSRNTFYKLLTKYNIEH